MSVGLACAIGQSQTLDIQIGMLAIHLYNIYLFGAPGAHRSFDPGIGLAILILFKN